jgi:hypothetical protein
MTTNVDQEIKELEERLSSLKAEQQLLRAQESLNKEKAASLLEDESLAEFIQQLQEKLAEYKLGLALSLNYKQNWVFLVKDDNSKDGLSEIKVLDLKDKCIFYGSVESYNDEITIERIRTWLAGALGLVGFLKRVKSRLTQDNLYGVTFTSYDSAFDKFYFTLSHFVLDSYDCVLTAKHPYNLNLSQQLNFDVESSSIYFSGGGVSLVTQANSNYIHDEDYIGSFKQKLTVESSFTKLTELGEVAKELQDKLAKFYEGLKHSYK